jgi:Tfp pilus assembly protein PilF
MAEDLEAEPEKKDEEKLEFTPEGEGLGYISMDQARVLALRIARESTDFYGPAYPDEGFVQEELGAEEGEDYYRVRLSYRPATGFNGTPGVELFIIDKVGEIESRQLLSSPRPKSVMLPTLAALGGSAVVGVVVVVLFATGVFSLGGVTGMAGGSATGTSDPTDTSIPGSIPQAPADAELALITPTPSPDANLHVQKGQEHVEEGRYEQAISEFDEAIGIDSENPTVYLMRGLAYFRMGQHEMAVQDYDEAIQLDPRSYGAYLSRGIIHATLGRSEKAIQDYDEAVRLNPDDLGSYINRANAYVRLEQYEKAVEDYDESLKISPEHAGVYSMRSVAHASLGDTAKAESDRTRACELEPLMCR